MNKSVVKYLSVGVLMCVPMLSMASTNIEDSIKQKITQYETTLNDSDLEGIVNLYDNDAVLIAPDNVPSVGKEAIHTAYTQIFSAVKLNIKFKFDEVTQLSKDWAIARTRSTGTIKILNGQDITIPESNNELFVLHRDSNKKWNISKYVFNTNTPPKK